MIVGKNIGRGWAFAVVATAILGMAACSDRDDGNGAIGSELGCSDCSIVIDSITTLVGADFIGPATSIEVAPSGQFYVADVRENVLNVYSPTGTLDRSIGRKGGGPGEFEMVRNLLFDDEGRLHLVDGALSRHSVFDVNGQFVRSYPAAVTGGRASPALLLDDHRLILNLRPASTKDSVHSLVVMDSTGVGTPLQGQAEPAYPRRRWLSDRLLWKLPDGRIFVGHPYTGQIDVYNPDLTQSSTMIRSADWLPTAAPENPPVDGLFDRPFTPQLRGMWVDDSSRLWILVMIPDEQWIAGPAPQEGERLPPESLSVLMKRPRVETILEVIDLQTRQVLARLRSDKPIGSPFGGGYVAITILGPAGEPGVQVSRISLKR